MSARLPGATLGILGGGQLARMTALAARPLGVRVLALDPHADCPAAGLVDALTVAPFDDLAACEALARQVDVLTLDIERIDARAARAAHAIAPLRPGPEVLATIQDRAAQKAWLEGRGFPLGPWRAAEGVEALARAAAALGGPCRAKAARGGYDGRGQAALPGPEAAAEAHAALGGAPAVVEAELHLVAELSVLVARRPSGELRCHPPSLNRHRGSVLDVAVVPAPLPAPLLSRAEDLARAIAEAMQVEGLLAVELFLVEGGELLVNELAPRPHNSYHHSIEGNVTSQFEQLVRAALDLPLGDPSLRQPTATANLLGDLWLGPRPPPFEALLASPGIKLHLYGKQPRPRRKLGHLTASADSPEAAEARVREARRRLFEGAGVPEQI